MSKANKQRLINSAYLFVRDVAEPCSVKKLFLLLYVLDVSHYQTTGRTVTGAEYAAGDYGPYPHEFANELQDMHSVGSLLIVERSPESGERDLVRTAPDAAAHFADDQFSRYQLALITSLAAKYRDGSYGLVDVGLYDHGAWRKALQIKKHQLISLDETVDPASEVGKEALSQSSFFKGREQRLAQFG